MAAQEPIWRQVVEAHGERTAAAVFGTEHACLPAARQQAAAPAAPVAAAPAGGMRAPL